MKRNGLKYIILSGSFLILGVMLVGWGCFIFKSTLIDGTWIRVSGVIVDYKTIEAEENINVPVIKYTVDNKTYNVESKSGFSGLFSISKPEIGTVKEIYYDPTNPNNSIVNENFAPFQVLSILLISSGIIFIYLSVYNFYTYTRQKLPNK